MTSRTLAVLAAALVVLALLALYGQRSEGPPPQNDQLLLPELEAALADVNRVSVVAAGGEPAATLERRDDRWAVAEKDGYPADVVKLREALVGLAEARIVEQKTSNPEYYERLGVEPVESEDAGGVAVTAHAGDAGFPAVIVGDAAGGGYQYVRRADEATSYLVDRELDVPRSAAEWVDPSIVDIRGTRVARITIEHPDGETVSIFKDDEEQTNFTVENLPEGRELQYAGVANVIGNSLRELRLEDVEAADSVADEDPEPVRTTFRTFDGLIVTVTAFERDDGAWISLEAGVDEGARSTAEVEAGDRSGERETSGEAGDTFETGDPAGDAAESPDEGAGASASTDQASVAAESAAATDREDEALDPRAEAVMINERTGGWRYKIPSYQFDQMTRRMDDLLAARDSE